MCVSIFTQLRLLSSSLSSRGGCIPSKREVGCTSTFNLKNANAPYSCAPTRMPPYLRSSRWEDSLHRSIFSHFHLLWVRAMMNASKSRTRSRSSWSSWNRQNTWKKRKEEKRKTHLFRSFKFERMTESRTKLCAPINISAAFMRLIPYIRITALIRWTAF